MIVYPLQQLRHSQISFYQQAQPSWWRPKAMVSALCNSYKQALYKLMSASERGRKSIPRITSMLVSANKKLSLRIESLLGYLEVSFALTILCHEGWAINLCVRTSVFLVPEASCAVGDGPDIDLLWQLRSFLSEVSTFPKREKCDSSS